MWWCGSSQSPVWEKGGHFTASTKSFSELLLVACAEVCVENSDGKDEVQTWRNSKLADTSTTSSNKWLMCSAVPKFCPKQGIIQKEEVEEEVGCRGQEVALESGSSIFKARLDQLKVPKQFTQTLLASFSCIDCSEDKLHSCTCHTNRAPGLNENLFLPLTQTPHWEEVWLLSFTLLKNKNINKFFPWWNTHTFYYNSGVDRVRHYYI